MILVCGGAGYIGSHLTKLLRQKGVSHLVLDNLERGHRESVSDSPFVQADLRDPDAINDVFLRHQIEQVISFAAYIEVGESVTDPAIFYQNNVMATWNLLGAMRAHGVKKFVFSSTAAVYGEPQVIPIPESHPKDPTNPYGETKLAVERMLRAYDRAYGIKSVCLRYFNACGADPEGELGEAHDPETHLIPRVLLAIAGRAPAMNVFGTDYDAPDGTCLRDYVHVWDLARAHLIAVEHLAAGGESRRYNLGSGGGSSVTQIIAAAEEVTGLPVPVTFGPRREGDPARLIADTSRIHADWSWSPEIELKASILHAWNWMKSHPHGYS